MKIGIGVSGFTYFQSDDKIANLLNPLATYFPSHRGKSTYDADGWPVTIDTTTWDDWSFMLAMDWYIKPGRYRIDAIGSGTVLWQNPGVPNGGVIDFHAPTPGARSVGGEYDLQHAGSLFGITATSATDHLRDVRIYRIDVDPTKTFTPEDLADLAPFAAFRMSAWPPMLARDTVTWSDDPKHPETRQWLAGIELCNKLGRDPWIQVPYSAGDDYIKGMARLYKANLAPGLKVYLEYSNEIWNWFGPFGAGTKWVDDWRKANMPQCPLGQAYVYRAAHAYKVFAAEAPAVPIVRVIAFQHTDPNYFRDALVFMGGTSGEITFASGIEPVPAGGLKFDAVATAPYADAQTHCDFAKIGALMTSGVAADKEKAYQLVFDGYYATIEDNERASLAYRTLMDGLGMRAIVYECGPGLSFDPSSGSAWMFDLLTATYDDPRMRKFMTEAYYPYLARYYDLVMYTQHADKPTPGKYWGIKKNLYDNTSPKWLSTTDWIANQQGDVMAKPVLLTDGGFETVKVGAGQFKSNPTGSAWAFVGGSGIAANGSGFTYSNPKAPDGTQVAFLQGNGSISTTFTTPDAPYQVRFEAAQRATYNAVRQDLEVLVDDVSVGKFTPLGRDYQSFATATFKGTSHKLTIKGLNTAGGDNTALVDKVSIAPVAVTPIPTPTPTPPPDPTPTPTPTPPPDPTPTPTPTPPAPDLAAESADVNTKAAAVGDAITALSAQVDALKAAASKLAADAAKKP